MCTLFVLHPVLNLALSALGYVLHLLTYAGQMQQVVNPGTCVGPWQWQ
jgi:hypothetical protein